MRFSEAIFKDRLILFGAIARTVYTGLTRTYSGKVHCSDGATVWLTDVFSVVFGQKWKSLVDQLYHAEAAQQCLLVRTILLWCWSFHWIC